MRGFFKRLVVALLVGEAHMVLNTYRPRIVAVTGSVGKTSTKDAIYCVLVETAYTRKSEKSFNSEIGVPLTILGVPNAWRNPLRWVQNILDGFFLILFPAGYPRWLVLEIGADRRGDVHSIAAWLPADVVVLTRLPETPVHVEYFDSPEELMEEKASLIEALKPEGVLVLYGDDERTRVLKNRTKGQSVILFGFSEGMDVRGEDFNLLFKDGHLVGMSARIVMGKRSAPVEVEGAVGTHAFLPLLAAAAVGHALGKNLVEVVQGLTHYTPPPGRMHLLQGLKDTLIIDDTYNSSPAAALAALDTLEEIKKSDSPKKSVLRTIAVLGDMLELGRRSVEEHRKVGAHAAKTADIVLTVGFRARDIAQGALDAGMHDSNIFQYEDARIAGKELEAMLQAGDVVLVKGSQSMRMERAVEEIMAEPERTEDLLVRQDAEWKKH